MGQRLVIAIYKNEKQTRPLASIYYHWSAYSESALEEFNKLFDDQDVIRDLVNNSIEKSLLPYLCSKISGVSKDDIIEYANRCDPAYDMDRPLDRNDGIMAISESGIDKQLDWSEGTLCVYLEEEIFDFIDLLWLMDEEDLSEVEEHDIIDYDLNGVSFYNHGDLYDAISEYKYIRHNGYIFGVIA